MIIMSIIYIAGVISGIALVVIALVGWIRQSGKAIQGGDLNQTPPRHLRTARNTYTGTTSLEGYRKDRNRGPDRPTPRIA